MLFNIKVEIYFAPIFAHCGKDKTWLVNEKELKLFKKGIMFVTYYSNLIWFSILSWINTFRLYGNKFHFTSYY